jgi:SAM-dependent methyltransferase
MLPETYRMLAEREDTYWWHLTRRSMSIRLLRKCNVPRGACWLDLGCGPGGNLALSESFAARLAVGVDIAPIALSIARQKKPGASLVRADLNNSLPFDEGTFDVVTVFNVLYHDWVKNEGAVVNEIGRVLRSGGVFLITEPAFTVLAREMDVAAMGHRRYRLADVASLIERAGLRVGRASYFTSFGFPLLFVMKMMRRLRFRRAGTRLTVAADMKPLNPFVNELLRRLSSVEGGAIAASLRVPFGTTLLCLARKP